MKGMRNCWRRFVMRTVYLCPYMSQRTRHIIGGQCEQGGQLNVNNDKNDWEGPIRRLVEEEGEAVAVPPPVWPAGWPTCCQLEPQHTDLARAPPAPPCPPQLD